MRRNWAARIVSARSSKWRAPCCRFITAPRGDGTCAFRAEQTNAAVSAVQKVDDCPHDQTALLGPGRMLGLNLFRDVFSELVKWFHGLLGSPADRANARGGGRVRTTDMFLGRVRTTDMFLVSAQRWHPRSVVNTLAICADRSLPNAAIRCMRPPKITIWLLLLQFCGNAASTI